MIHKKARHLPLVMVIAVSICIPLTLIGAESTHDVTKYEARLLPDYCQFIVPFGSRQNYLAPQPKQKKKNDKPGLQHFCHGLKHMIRADMSAGNKGEVHENLNRAVGQFEYILGYVDPTDTEFSTYLAATSTAQAKALQRLGRKSEAMMKYQYAIRLDPKLVRAYAGLSDLYQESGMRDDARQILERGLIVAPESKSLKNRMSELSE